MAAPERSPNTSPRLPSECETNVYNIKQYKTLARIWLAIDVGSSSSAARRRLMSSRGLFSAPSHLELGELGHYMILSVALAF